MGHKDTRDPHAHFSRKDLRRCGQDGKKLYLTIEDTAAHFQVAKHTVLEWCRVGVVHEYRLGGRIYLNRLEIAAYWEVFQNRG